MASCTLIAGCVTNAPLPDPAHDQSVVEFVRDLEQTTSTLLDKVVVALPNPQEQHEGFYFWSADWCPRHALVNSDAGVRREIGRYCESASGKFDGKFCRQSQDPDSILFYADVTSATGANCQGVANPVGVRTVTPIGGNLHRAGYISALRKVGYLTLREQADAAMERERTAQENDRIAREKAKREQERVAEEMPLLTSRGTKICRTNGEWLYIGFVEDAANHKIQIRVADMRYASDPSSGMRPGGFAPGQLIWDFPANWRVCD